MRDWLARARLLFTVPVQPSFPASGGPSLPLFTAFFFVVSLVLTGYQVFLVNHAIQIALVHLLQDHTLFPGDPYVPALARYASLLWRGVAWVTRVVPLEPFLLVSFLLERLFYLYAVSRLARAFMPLSKLAPIAAMAAFALSPGPLLGSGTILLSYFEQTTLALAFFMLAMAYLLEERPSPWAVCMAVGFNLQSMYGIFAVTFCAGFFALNPRYWKHWAVWARGLGLLLLLASPALYAGFSVLGHKEVADNQLWLLVSKIRSPWHLYPLTWPRTNFAKFGALMLFIGALLSGRRQNSEKVFRAFVGWSVAACFWVVIAFLAAYVFKSPAMLMFQPCRATDLWTCLAIVAMTSASAMALEESGSLPAQWKIHLLTLMVSILVWSPVHPFFMLILTGIIVTLAVDPLASWVWRPGRVWRTALSIALGVAMLAAHAFWIRFQHKKTLLRTVIARPSSAVEAVSAWALEKTPVDTVFLVDPISTEWDIFRALSRRSIYTNFEEGGAIHWDRRFATPWNERLEALGFNLAQQLTNPRMEEDLRALYQNLSDEGVRRLKTKYSLHYWIVPNEHASRYPTAFQSGEWKVLDVR